MLPRYYVTKKTAGLANFIFYIKSNIFIILFDFYIVLKLIIFYIFFVNTTFLLYLADINKLGIFFKNITN